MVSRDSRFEPLMPVRCCRSVNLGDVGRGGKVKMQLNGFLNLPSNRNQAQTLLCKLFNH